MSREQERIRKKLEKNPVAECNKIQKKFGAMVIFKISLRILRLPKLNHIYLKNLHQQNIIIITQDQQHYFSQKQQLYQYMFHICHKVYLVLHSKTK